VGVRDASILARQKIVTNKEPLLVLTSFLARGGAEHTLFETLRLLQDRFSITLVTLAPHRPELGDRRADFLQITERILCLGDLVHPAVMPGILASLLHSTGARILHNSNGTTLFYEFIPGLKQTFPELRVVDHLYDHQVGYIDRYNPELLASVDACVAENHRIAKVLVEERGWPRERVPVIWPCGRRRDAFPEQGAMAEIRRRLRRELRIAPEDLLILTAARMHGQKRPLDLVYLARRTQDLHQVHYLLVGGGDLADEVDAAIAAQPAANIRRLPFRTDIPQLIIAADVGCLVSDYEGLPVFMLECLQAGRPFLGTDVGEMGNVLRDTGAGLVVDTPGDLEALEDQIRSFLDTSLWTDLAEKAMAAGEGFEVEGCAESYAAAFLGED
jgi:glycosyltransferase involved in cell wall biosynthesis